MQDNYPTIFLNRLFDKYYSFRWEYREDEIRQIMWTSLFESLRKYERYHPKTHFEEYAEKVIVDDVGRWITENGYYCYRYLSLDKPFRDSDDTMLSVFLADEDTFCSLELFDFISRLSFIKFAICKSYIYRFDDEDIVRWLGISGKRLGEIKAELQQDFIQGYFI